MLRERVAPARLAVTLEQNRIVRKHEEHIRLYLVLPELFDQTGQRLEIQAPVAGIDANRESAADLSRDRRHLLDDRLEQTGRQVVDAVIAQVLEHVKRNGLSGAG